MGSLELAGCLSFLEPLRERSDGVKSVGTFSTAAMSHPRKHEQADRISRRPAHRRQNTLVIVDSVERSDIWIAPSVIHQQLSTVAEEFLQIRIHGASRAIVDLVGNGHVAIEVQSAKVPVRVVERYEFKAVGGER